MDLQRISSISQINGQRSHLLEKENHCFPNKLSAKRLYHIKRKTVGLTFLDYKIGQDILSASRQHVQQYERPRWIVKFFVVARSMLEWVEFKNKSPHRIGNQLRRYNDWALFHSRNQVVYFGSLITHIFIGRIRRSFTKKIKDIR